MEKIASFKVDHETLKKGLYISRVDADVITYDLRMTRPNLQEPMESGEMHTIEHLGATFLRNSEHKDRIIYFGPMGCRTGFYLLTRELSGEVLIELLKKCFAFIESFSGEIPGASPKECGNYRDMDADGAKIRAAAYGRVLERWTVEQMSY